MNPKLALAHSVFGLVLGIGGRHEEALQQVLHARELDPLSLFINAGVAWVHHFAGRAQDAVREALKAREIVPGFEEAGNVLISSYEALDHVERMADEHIGGCVFLGVDPNLSSLRGHPRYEAVLSRVGVAPPRTASAAHTTST